jgi:chromate transporter
MMQEEEVKERKRMDEQHFLDRIGATNLFPLQNSTGLAIHMQAAKALIPPKPSKKRSFRYNVI